MYLCFNVCMKNCLKNLFHEYFLDTYDSSLASSGDVSSSFDVPLFDITSPLNGHVPSDANWSKHTMEDGESVGFAVATVLIHARCEESSKSWSDDVQAKDALSFTLRNADHTFSTESFPCFMYWDLWFFSHLEVIFIYFKK